MRHVKWLFWGAVALVSWLLVAALLGSYRFPSPQQLLPFVFESLFSSGVIYGEGGGQYGFAPHIAATLTAFVPAVAAGTVIGLHLAAVIQFSGLFGRACEAVLEFFRTLPPLIIIPFFLLCVDPGYISVLSSALLYGAYSTCFFALGGMRRTDRRFVEMARLSGASRWQLWRTVYLPALIPDLVAGMRLSGSLALGIVVVAEYLGSARGLGRTIKYGISYSSALLLFTGMFWAVMIGLCYDIILTLLTRRCLRWSERGKQGAALRNDW